METEQRKKLLIIGAIAAVVILLGDKMLISPLTNLWQKRAKEIEFLEKDVMKGRALLEREDFLKRRWDDMIRESLPENQPAAESVVFTQLDEWARFSQFDVSSITPQWRDDEEDNLRYLVRIEGNGNMRSITDFLFAIDQKLLPIKVESVEMVSKDKRGTQVGVDLRISGLILPRPRQQ